MWLKHNRLTAVILEYSWMLLYDLEFAFISWMHSAHKSHPCLLLCYFYRIKMSRLLFYLCSIETFRDPLDLDVIIAKTRRGEQCLTFLNRDWPNWSGWMVTAPCSASSKMVADTVVLIGTPSLLTCNTHETDDNRRWQHNA